jgi:hypothetical protein
MTTQTIQVTAYNYGSSLPSVSLRHATTYAEIATADTSLEVVADCGVYNCVFVESVVIAAGTYRLLAIVDGEPLNRWVTLAGVADEIVIASEAYPLPTDTAVQAQLEAIHAIVQTLQAPRSRVMQAY